VRNPNTQLVIDHLGLQQPFEPPPPAEPFTDLSKVLALAAHNNIAIKISGACTLSHEPFPYKDIWDPLGRHLRRLWPRSLHVGYRLDAGGRIVDPGSPRSHRIKRMGVQ
jgi:predicted TIM-barrel fold metal-dependent hydrolase